MRKSARPPREPRAPSHQPVRVRQAHIPCCVPYWEAPSFFAAGGLYSADKGYHLSPNAYLAAFEEWLPRKWQHRGIPFLKP